MHMGHREQGVAVKKRKTTVGEIDSEVLDFTAGQDVQLDLALVKADCLGTAAHVRMLARMPVKPPLISPADTKKVIAELRNIIAQAQRGAFKITLADQDVHLAVERTLTSKLGDLGKKVHTGRSRNDQVAVDLRLYAKEQICGAIREVALLIAELIDFAKKHAADPMVGRTHMQPAMPSSVGLWASAHAESLLDDVALLMTAYELNDQCPLGSAAGYGAPMPLDRQLVSDLLGFSRPVHNVLYANNARGKMESVILMAVSQVMLTLSRLAQDLMLFSMPEFGYFTLPSAFCTGSSIMPQKRNPDVLELVRAKAAKVMASVLCVAELIRGAPSGYNRDLQEAKGPFMKGMHMTRTSLQIMKRLMAGIQVNRKALLAGFKPDVFATDRALELVAGGLTFRDAYHHVKQHLDELKTVDPYLAIAKKTHLGATAGLDFGNMSRRVRQAAAFAEDEKRMFERTWSKLMDP
jgi:argininosuccinate lyase